MYKLVTVPFRSAYPDLPRTDGNQLNVCWYKCFCTNFCWETSCLSYWDPENKHGVLGGDKIKITKMREYNENGQKRQWRPLANEF